MQQDIVPNQKVISFDQPVGGFLITEKMILEIPFDNFVEFSHALQEDALARHLDIMIEDHPSGVIIYWKPSV